MHFKLVLDLKQKNYNGKLINRNQTNEKFYLLNIDYVLHVCNRYGII